MLSVFFHALEVLAYHLIISVVDRVSRLLRNKHHSLPSPLIPSHPPCVLR